jgi:hypothetical protein
MRTRPRSMAAPRRFFVRWAVRLGMMALITMAFLLGCGGIEHPPLRQQESAGHPAAPRITAERLQDCAYRYASQLDPGARKFRPTVQVYQDGRIANVLTDDIPMTAPDFGGCTRATLRDMAIPHAVLQTLLNLRQTRLAASTSKPTMAQRTQLGSPAIVILGVAIVLGEIVIEAVGYTILFAITVELVDEVGTAVAGVLRRLGEDEDKRCGEVKEKCIAYCSGSPGLPAPGGGRFRRCMRECMEAEGCSF